jgi:hypothetical protein
MQQDVVERFAAPFAAATNTRRFLPRRLLADELVEALRAKRRVGVLAGALRSGDAGGIGGHPLR